MEVPQIKVAAWVHPGSSSRSRPPPRGSLVNTCVTKGHILYLWHCRAALLGLRQGWASGPPSRVALSWVGSRSRAPCLPQASHLSRARWRMRHLESTPGWLPTLPGPACPPSIAPPCATLRCCLNPGSWSCPWAFTGGARREAWGGWRRGALRPPWDCRPTRESPLEAWTRGAFR